LEFQASDIDRTISQLEGLLKKAAGAKKSSSLKIKKTKSTSSNKVAPKKKGKKVVRERKLSLQLKQPT
jgi:hypothetical protein